MTGKNNEESYSSSSGRFIIDCYGIIDTWKSHTGECEKDKLSWSELCDTLNELDRIADDKFENYEYVIRLEKENMFLKKKLMSISRVNMSVKDCLSDIDLIISKKE